MLTIKMLLPTLDNQVGILIDDRLNFLQVICLYLLLRLSRDWYLSARFLRKDLETNQKSATSSVYASAKILIF